MQFNKVAATFVKFGAKESFTTKEGKKITNSFSFFDFNHDYGPDFDGKIKTVRFKLSDKVTEALRDNKIKLEPGITYEISGGFETRSSEKDGKTAHFTEAYISRITTGKQENAKKQQPAEADNDLPF